MPCCKADLIGFKTIGKDRSFGVDMTSAFVLKLVWIWRLKTIEGHGIDSNSERYKRARASDI